MVHCANRYKYGVVKQRKILVIGIHSHLDCLRICICVATNDMSIEAPFTIWAFDLNTIHEHFRLWLPRPEDSSNRLQLSACLPLTSSHVIPLLAVVKPKIDVQKTRGLTSLVVILRNTLPARWFFLRMNPLLSELLALASFISSFIRHKHS